MKTGRTVVINGAAGDTGAEFVGPFLESGHAVIATGTSAEALEKLFAHFGVASPDADFITGQTIIVDGGHSML